jgi:hypothetical protein
MRLTIAELRTYINENVSWILVENRIDDAKNRYPDIAEDVFNAVVQAQPPSSNNKYLMWSMAQAAAGESAQDIAETIALFEQNKQRLQKKDLNQYKTIDEVDAEIEKLGVSKSSLAKKAKKDADPIYEDDKYFVVRPNTTEASQKYGANTRWCIAATSSQNYFKSYSTNNNKFYFVITKDATPGTPSSKYAIALVQLSPNQRETQVFDATDKMVGMTVLEKYLGDKWPIIWEKIAAHAQKFPKTWEVIEEEKSTEEILKGLANGKNLTFDQLTKVTTRTSKLDLELVKKIVAQILRLNNDWEKRHIFERLLSIVAEGNVDAATTKFILLKILTRNDTVNFFALDNTIKFANLSDETVRELAVLIEENPSIDARAKESIISTLATNKGASNETFNALVSKYDGGAHNASGAPFTASQIVKKLSKNRIARGLVPLAEFENLMKNKDDAYNVVWSRELWNISKDYAEKIPFGRIDILQMLHFENVSTDYMVKQVIKFASEKADEYRAHQKDKDVEHVITSPRFDRQSLDALWSGLPKRLRPLVLLNPNVDVETLTKIASSKSGLLRYYVAKNPRTPVEGLKSLSKDPSASMRVAVAENPNTDKETLKYLGGDDVTQVRAAVAGNVKAGKAVITILAKDSDPSVRKHARNTLKSTSLTEMLISSMLSMSSLNEALGDDADDESDDDYMSPSWQSMLGVFNWYSVMCVYILQSGGQAPIDRAIRIFGNNEHSVKAAKKLVKSNAFRLEGGFGKTGVVKLTNESLQTAIRTVVTAREKKINDQHPRQAQQFTISAPPKALARPKTTAQPTIAVAPAAAATAAAAPPRRGAKTTYKIYGKFKGHPAATRLKGQAYVAGNDTQFKSGEQAIIEPEDGKLRVKKTTGDHSQLWDPIDG